MQKTKRSNPHVVLHSRSMPLVRSFCLRGACSHQESKCFSNASTIQIYTCEICSQVTQLDSSTVSELNALAKSYVRMPTSVKLHGRQNTNTGNKSRTMNRSRKKNTGEYSPSKRIVYYCKEHSEEEISYYCFNCQDNICPECAIHGIF